MEKTCFYRVNEFADYDIADEKDLIEAAQKRAAYLDNISGAGSIVKIKRERD